MNAQHTISEVAARTGFTASALRFYETAGLITPGRTGSGYRIYDDRSIERLRFIARAKQLGLRLDEITELASIWEGERCAPVAERLSDLVAAKIAETQTRIAELATFANDLERFHEGLIDDPADGPCGDDCACQASIPSASAVVPLTTTPTGTESPLIACTLAPNDVAGRVDDWRALLARSIKRTAVDGGVTVRFPPGSALAAEIGAMAAAEQSCCGFFTFTLRIDHTATDLTVTAPPEAAGLVDALFDATA